MAFDPRQFEQLVNQYQQQYDEVFVPSKRQEKEERISQAALRKKAALSLKPDLDPKQAEMPWQQYRASEVGLPMWDQPHEYGAKPHVGKGPLMDALKLGVYEGQEDSEDPIVEVQERWQGDDSANPWGAYRNPLSGKELSHLVAPSGDFAEDKHARNERVKQLEAAIKGELYVPQEFNPKFERAVQDEIRRRQFNIEKADREDKAILTDKQASSGLGWAANAAIGAAARGAKLLLADIPRIPGWGVEAAANMAFSPEEQKQYSAINWKQKAKQPLTPEEVEFTKSNTYDDLEELEEINKYYLDPLDRGAEWLMSLKNRREENLMKSQGTDVAWDKAFNSEETSGENYRTAKAKFWATAFDPTDGLYSQEAVDKKELGRDLTVEHVVPMSWVGKQLGCGTRAECRKTSRRFNEIEADMHNFEPALYKFNKLRGNKILEELPNQQYFGTNSGIKMDSKNQKIAPPKEMQGRVSRAMLYMSEHYGLELSQKHLDMLQRWNKANPPTEAEQSRNRRIAALQGAENPWMKKAYEGSLEAKGELDNGNIVSGGIKLAGQVTELAAGYIDVAINHPGAVTSIFAESLPDMIGLKKSFKLVATALAGDLYSRGVVDFEKIHNRMPNPVESLIIAGTSSASVLLERLGANVSLDPFMTAFRKVAGKEAAEKVKKEVTEEASKGWLKRVGEGSAKFITSAPVKGFVGESATEFTQELLESFAGKQSALDEEDLKKAYFGAVAGGLGGGGAASVGPVAAGSLKGFHKGTERVADSRLGRAVAGGRQGLKDRAAGKYQHVVDPTSPDYDAREAARAASNAFRDATSIAEQNSIITDMKEAAGALKRIAEDDGAKMPDRQRAMDNFNVVAQQLRNFDKQLNDRAADIVVSPEATPDQRTEAEATLAKGTLGSEDMAAYEQIANSETATPEMQNLAKDTLEFHGDVETVVTERAARTGKTAKAVRDEILSEGMNAENNPGLGYYMKGIASALSRGNKEEADTVIAELATWQGKQKAKLDALNNAELSETESTKVTWGPGDIFSATFHPGQRGRNGLKSYKAPVSEDLNLITKSLNVAKQARDVAFKQAQKPATKAEQQDATNPSRRRPTEAARARQKTIADLLSRTRALREKNPSDLTMQSNLTEIEKNLTGSNINPNTFDSISRRLDSMEGKPVKSKKATEPPNKPVDAVKKLQGRLNRVINRALNADLVLPEGTPEKAEHVAISKSIIENFENPTEEFVAGVEQRIDALEKIALPKAKSTQQEKPDEVAQIEVEVVDPQIDEETYLNTQGTSEEESSFDDAVKQAIDAMSESFQGDTDEKVQKKAVILKADGPNMLRVFDENNQEIGFTTVSIHGNRIGLGPDVKKGYGQLLYKAVLEQNPGKYIESGAELSPDAEAMWQRLLKKEEAISVQIGESQYVYRMGKVPKETNGDVITNTQKTEPKTVSTKAEIVINNISALRNAHSTNKGIYTMRISGGKLSGILNLDREHHFGNPFGETAKKTSATIPNAGTGQEASERYRAWLNGTGDQNVEPARRDWIRKQILDGKLDGQNLLYFQNPSTLTHAKVLLDFVNNKTLKAPVPPKAAKVATEEKAKTPSIFGNGLLPQGYFTQTQFPWQKAIVDNGGLQRITLNETGFHGKDGLKRKLIASGKYVASVANAWIDLLDGFKFNSETLEKTIKNFQENHPGFSKESAADFKKLGELRDRFTRVNLLVSSNGTYEQGTEYVKLTNKMTQLLTDILARDFPEIPVEFGYEPLFQNTDKSTFDTTLVTSKPEPRQKTDSEIQADINKITSSNALREYLKDLSVPAMRRYAAHVGLKPRNMLNEQLIEFILEKVDPDEKVQTQEQEPSQGKKEEVTSDQSFNDLSALFPPLPAAGAKSPNGYATDISGIRSIADIKKWFRSNPIGNARGALFERVSRILPDDLRIIHTADLSPKEYERAMANFQKRGYANTILGWYDPATDAIYINDSVMQGRHPQLISSLFLHEMLHAALVYIVDTAKTNPKQLSKAAQKAYSELEDGLAYIKKQFPDIAANNESMFKNVDELMSHTLSSRRDARLANSLHFTIGKQVMSLMDKIKEFLRKALGNRYFNEPSETSLLNKVINNADILLTEAEDIGRFADPMTALNEDIYQDELDYYLSQAITGKKDIVDDVLLPFLEEYGFRLKDANDFMLDIASKEIFLDKKNYTHISKAVAKSLSTMLQGSPEFKEILSKINTPLMRHRAKNRLYKLRGQLGYENVPINAQAIERESVLELLESGLNRKIAKELGIPTETMSRFKILVNDVLDFFRSIWNKYFLPADPNSLRALANRILTQVYDDPKFLKNRSLQPGAKLLNFNKAFQDNKHAASILEWFAPQNVVLTGSIAYAPQGTIYRNPAKAVHDLDLLLGRDLIKSEVAAEVKQEYPGTVILLEAKFLTTLLVPPVGYSIQNLTQNKGRAASYDMVEDATGKVVDHYQAVFKKVKGKWADELVKEDHSTAFQPTLVDLMTDKLSEESYSYDWVGPSGKKVTVNLATAKHGFTKKLEYARAKDIRDYINFMFKEQNPGLDLYPSAEDKTVSIYEKAFIAFENIYNNTGKSLVDLPAKIAELGEITDPMQVALDRFIAAKKAEIAKKVSYADNPLTKTLLAGRKLFKTVRGNKPMAIPNFLSLWAESKSNADLREVLNNTIKIDSDTAQKLDDMLADPTVLGLMLKTSQKIMESTQWTKTTLFEKNPINLFRKELATTLTHGDNPIHTSLVHAMAVVATDFIANRAMQTFYKEDENINRLLSEPSSDAPITSLAYQKLRHIGDPQEILAQELGEQVLKAMGMTELSEAPGGTYANMATSIGMVLLDSLARQNMVKRNVVQVGLFAELRHPQTLVEAAANPATLKFFISLHPDVETDKWGNTQPIPEFRQIHQNLVGHRETLRKVFAISAERRDPSDEPVTEVNNQVGRTTQELSSLQNEAVSRAQQVPMVLNKRPYSSFNRLSKGMKYLLAGLNTGYETAHVELRDGIKAKNEDLKNDVDNLDDFVTARGLDLTYYTKYKFWRNVRIGDISNTVNAQASKVGRWLVAAKSWEYTYKFKDDATGDMDSLIIAIMGGFGMTPDKPNNTLENMRNTFRTTVMDPATGKILNEDYAAAAKLLEKGDKQFLPEEEAVIQKAVDQGGEGIHSFLVLQTLADLSAAIRNGEDTWTGTVSVETDGKTNGPASAVFQLGGDSVGDLNMTKAAGMLYAEDKLVEYPHWGGFDNYQTLSLQTENEIQDPIHGMEANYEARKAKIIEEGVKVDSKLRWLEETKRIADWLYKNLYNELSKIDDETGKRAVSSEGRDLSKDPLMVSAYGAELKSVARAIKAKGLEGLYAKMAEAQTEFEKAMQLVRDNPNGGAELQSRVLELALKKQVLIDAFKSFKNDNFDIQMGDNLREYTFGKWQLLQLFDGMGQAYTDHNGRAINNMLGTVKYNKGYLNTAVTLMNVIFAPIFNAEIKKRSAAKGSRLSKEEIRALEKEARDEGWMPTLKHATSNMDPDVHNDSLAATAQERVEVDSIEFTGPQANRLAEKDDRAEATWVRLDEKDGETVQYASMSAKVHEWRYTYDVGVAPFTWLNLAMDGNTQAYLMAVIDMINVHDAHIVGAAIAREAAALANESHTTIQTTYSIAESVYDAYKRMRKVYDKLPQSDPNKDIVTKDSIDELLISLDLQVADLGEKDTLDSFTKFDELLEPVVEYAEVARMKRVKNLRLNNQFPFPDASHLITPTEGKSAVTGEEKQVVTADKAISASESEVLMKDIWEQVATESKERPSIPFFDGKGYIRLKGLDEPFGFSSVENNGVKGVGILYKGKEIIRPLYDNAEDALIALRNVIAQYPSVEALEVDLEAESKILGSDEFSSSSARMKGFFTDSSEMITSSNVMRIFHSLTDIGNWTENGVHQAHLEKILNEVLLPGIRNMEVTLNHLKPKDGTKVLRNFGRVDLNGQVSLGAATIDPIIGNAMSMQELYVHEVLHAISRHVLDHNPRVAKEVKRLMLEAERVITWEDMVRPGANKNDPIEREMAEKRLKYIFKNKPGYLHEFFAFALSNQAFGNALNAKASTKHLRYDASAPFLDRLFQLFMTLVDWITNAVERRPNKQMVDVLQRLAEDIVKINNGKQSSIDKAYLKFQQWNSPLKEQLKEHAFKPWLKYAVERRQVPDRTKLRQTLDEIVSLPVNIATRRYREQVNNMAYSLGLTMDSVYYSFLDELAGPNDISQPYHDMLRKWKHMGDYYREHEYQLLSKKIREMMDNGMDIPEHDWEAMSAAYLKTDLVSLLGPFSLGKIRDFLADDRVLHGAINHAEQSIKQLEGQQGYFYIKQAHSLGSWMARGKVGLERQLMNPHNIAHRIATGYKAPENAEQLVPLVDQLASLYAIKYTAQHKRQIGAQYIDSEYGSNERANGVHYMLSIHKDIKERSQKENFFDNPTQMIKGWTTELFNEYDSVVVAPANDRQKMLDRGYKWTTDLDPDKYSSFGTRTMSLYVAHDGVLAKRVTGISSITGQRKKGSGFRDMAFDFFDGMTWNEANIFANKERVRMNNATKSNLDKQINGNGSLDFDTPHLVPSLDPNGVIADYRYLMTEEAKIKHLGKRDQAHMVLGRMSASIHDKKASRLRNVDMLLLAKADWDEGKEKEPWAYVTVGENSPDEKYREIWRLLPDATKDDMRRIWGEDNIKIRSDLVTITFGYQKASLLDWAEKHYGFKLPFVFDQAFRYGAEVYQAVVARGKRNIVVLLPEVVIGNILSNIALLITKGVPPVFAFKESFRAVQEMVAFQEAKTEHDNLAIDLRVYKNNKRKAAEIQHKMDRLQADMDRNPVKDIFDAGIFQNIVEDVDLQELQGNDVDRRLFSVYPGMRGFVESKVSKVPDIVQKGYRQAVVAPSTRLGEVLTKTVQYSDFTARYALIKWQMKEKGLELGKDKLDEDVLREAVETFINYDVPTSAEMQWINDMGPIRFTKYKLRVQRIFLRLLFQKPLTSATFAAGQRLFFDVPDIGDSWLGTTELLKKLDIHGVPSMERFGEGFELNIDNLYEYIVGQ